MHGLWDTGLGVVEAGRGGIGNSPSHKQCDRLIRVKGRGGKEWDKKNDTGEVREGGGRWRKGAAGIGLGRGCLMV